ncbi:MAG TPA: sulfotransferase family 2 domain-containing protein [Pseudolabrys sp.]|jgi:hypothetical protein|nr:sulfotransferase family 2 domain-containing protein [Pseudolabrys sp.]
MLLIDGKVYESQLLPTIFFGKSKPLAYVLNPKVASTLTLNFMFYVNYGYRFFEPYKIYFSQSLLRFEGPELDPAALSTFFKLAPQSFSIVRDPLRRFVSAFMSKIYSGEDPNYFSLRDQLTGEHGIDLSPEADLARSCLAFTKWIIAQPQKTMDTHFRPQYLNLGSDSRFAVDTVLRLEDPDSIIAFFAKWVGEDKAKWLFSLRLNQQQLSSKGIVTDELKDFVRTFYARDYELFYPEQL